MRDRKRSKIDQFWSNSIEKDHKSQNQLKKSIDFDFFHLLLDIKLLFLSKVGRIQLKRDQNRSKLVEINQKEIANDLKSKFRIQF